MRVEFRVRGTKRLNAKFKEIGNYVRGKYAPAVAMDGYKIARKIAPRDTGALIAAIKPPKKGKQSANIRLIQPNHPIDGTTKPYHLWMHGIKAPSQGGRGYDTSTGRYRPKSGEPKFMDVAFREMQRKATERFKKRFDKL